PRPRPQHHRNLPPISPLPDCSTILYGVNHSTTPTAHPTRCEVHMSTTPTTSATPTREGWFRSLGPRGKRAFVGAFGGYGLDSYDYWVLPLGLAAIAAYFGLTTGQAGLLTTVTLVVS